MEKYEAKFKIGDRIISAKGRGVVIGYDRSDGDLFVKWEDNRENHHAGGGRVVDETGLPIELSGCVGSWAVPSQTELDKEYKVLQILRGYTANRAKGVRVPEQPCR